MSKIVKETESKLYDAIVNAVNTATDKGDLP